MKWDRAVGIVILLLSSAVVNVRAQGTAADSPKGKTDELLTSDLIAWTDMQSPQPMPSTTQQAQRAPDIPQANQLGGPEIPTQDAQPTAQTFNGSISKEDGCYVLKVSHTTSYQLDNQEQARQYEGQRVTVMGALDSRRNLIRVQRIEPVS